MTGRHPRGGLGVGGWPPGWPGRGRARPARRQWPRPVSMGGHGDRQGSRSSSESPLTACEIGPRPRGRRPSSDASQVGQGSRAGPYLRDGHHHRATGRPQPILGFGTHDGSAATADLSEKIRTNDSRHGGTSATAEPVSAADSKRRAYERLPYGWVEPRSPAIAAFGPVTERPKTPLGRRGLKARGNPRKPSEAGQSTCQARQRISPPGRSVLERVAPRSTHGAVTWTPVFKLNFTL
jgi:hypothetical protein